MKPMTVPGRLKMVFIIVLLVGVLLRFCNLDIKPYWQDETYTSLRVSGSRYREAVQSLYTGRVLRAEEIQRFQQWSADKHAVDTIQGLATENSQHPPLYYVIAHRWAGWFGSSIAAMRALPALISLLVFPALYWLCRELFSDPSVGLQAGCSACPTTGSTPGSAVGWMAIGLAAVSPLYLRYAQEARQYSLWMVIILVSSVAFLRAIRLRSAWSWGWYGVTLVAGLYSHILFIFLIIAHGIYLIAIEGFILDKAVKRFMLVACAAIASFSPWLWTIWGHRETVQATTGWVQAPLAFLSLVQAWGVNICQLFIAWHFRHDDTLVYLALPVAVLIIAAVITLCRRTPRRIWLFVVLLIGVTAIPLIAADLLSITRLSVHPRYLLPGYVGMNVAVAYFLVESFTKRSRKLSATIWPFLVGALLMGVGITSCVIAVHSDTWWGWSEYDVDSSKIINRLQSPLVVSDVPLGVILPISHRLRPDARYLLSTQPETLVLPAASGAVFAYNPSDRLVAAMKQQGLRPDVIYQFKDDAFTFSLYQVQGSS
jgi:uncharacterized membrane protein